MRTAKLRTRLDSTGIRRLGSTRTGFRYRRSSGRAASATDVARIRALRIPPAWRDVAIAASPADKLQAVGRDAAGRWQYLYRASYTAHRARVKFNRLPAFGAALPALRAALRRDLARDALPLEKAQAGSVLLMAACALRPGASEYARDNGSFGLATLRDKHIDVRGVTVRLRFPGKHQVLQEQEIRSRTIARLLRVMKSMPGREVLKYCDETGAIRDIRRRHITDYVKAAMGSRFMARDFRTWTGTLTCASALRREHDAGTTPHKTAVANALRRTAEALGNTPAVVRSSYVHPKVIEAFLAGRVVSHAMDHLDADLHYRAVNLSRPERALLALLGRK